MPSEGLIRSLAESGIFYQRDVDLRSFSTFRIGGRAELVLYPRTAEEICRAACLLHAADRAFEIIGNGSNLLFGDGVLKKVLIVTKEAAHWEQNGNTLWAECGTTLASLAYAAAEASLSGLEFARGIPGTVGGSVFMNAGAYGGAISDVLTESWAWDSERESCMTVKEHDFDYRTGIYTSHPNWLCLGASFSLTEGDRESIRETMRAYVAQRREKQPLEYPSAGSYFKRPKGHFAGKLIEDCGMKGACVGGAKISEKHAGFLINTGGATAHDVLCLEEWVKETVFRRFGVELEREVRLIQ